jgi:site-specific recombinase XerC
MNNPFASLDLSSIRTGQKPSLKTKPNIDQMLKWIDVAKPNGARDRVVLLLRYKYRLRPSEISALNISDVDVNGGVLQVIRRSKKQVVIVDERDLLDFRRWRAVRKLYVSDLEAFLISMHWTRGRSELYQRISVRGVFLVVQKYASKSRQDG